VSVQCRRTLPTCTFVPVSVIVCRLVSMASGDSLVTPALWGYEPTESRSLRSFDTA